MLNYELQMDIVTKYFNSSAITENPIFSIYGLATFKVVISRTLVG